MRAFLTSRSQNITSVASALNQPVAAAEPPYPANNVCTQKHPARRTACHLFLHHHAGIKSHQYIFVHTQSGQKKKKKNINKKPFIFIYIVDYP